MGKLNAYVRSARERIEEVAEAELGDIRDAEVAELISDVALSVLRLSSGCPRGTRLRLRNALLTSGLAAAADVLDNPEPEDEEEEEAAAAEDVEEPEDVADVEAGGEAAETGDIQGVVERLWELEQPARLVPGEDLQLNEGSRAASLARGQDRCEEPLFASVDEEKLMTPLTRSFVALLDNYERDSSRAEEVTDQEDAEISRFLTLMSRTPQFRYVHNVLASWGKADESMDEFLSSVYSAWFACYKVGKRGKVSTSGFEHVFVGEEKYDYRTRKSCISGFHNWIQFYLEEKRGNVNYLGFLGHADDDLILSARFIWDDDDPEVEAKSVSTFLIGTSVAFEFSLATLCFFNCSDDDGKTRVCIGGNEVDVQTYRYNSRMGVHVRTVYLEA